MRESEMHLLYVFFAWEGSWSRKGIEGVGKPAMITQVLSLYKSGLMFRFEALA